MNQERDLSAYNQKYVRAESIYGDIFTGLARYEDYEYLRDEWGGAEDGLFVEDFILYRSQIGSIEEIRVHGTAELWTPQLTLRKVRPEDAEPLYRSLGTDPAAFPGRAANPYASPEAARENVHRCIGRYADERFYFWVMDWEDVVVGTIGAERLTDDRAEVSFRVARDWRGRGLATEALRKVLDYLTENEGLSCVTAFCTAEDKGPGRVLEKAGMRPAGTVLENAARENAYAGTVYEYRRKPAGEKTDFCLREGKQ